MEIKLVVYRTPIKAGSCYVFYNSIKRGVKPELQAKMAKAKKPTLQAHLDMLRFFVSALAGCHLELPLQPFSLTSLTVIQMITHYHTVTCC